MSVRVLHGLCRQMFYMTGGTVQNLKFLLQSTTPKLWTVGPKKNLHSIPKNKSTFLKKSVCDLHSGGMRAKKSQECSAMSPKKDEHGEAPENVILKIVTTSLLIALHNRVSNHYDKYCTIYLAVSFAH